MLSVTGIDAFYGPSQVLFGFSIEVGAGEVVTLMGRPGTGVTTAAVAGSLTTATASYVAMGSGFALIAVAAWLLPNPWMLPAMMAAGLIAGFGGPFYFIPMITRLQTAYRGAEIARVFRLRLAVMAGSMLAFNLAATPLFNLLGPTLTEFLFGLLILALGIGGHFYFGRIESRPQKIPV